MPSLFSTKVLIKLEMSEKLYEEYEKMGGANGHSVEEEIAKRLERCKEYTASRPLYFNDAERSEIEKLTGGHQAKSPETVLARLRTAMSIVVEDVTITINQRLLQRLSSRIFRGQTMEGVIEKVVLEALERHAGMRP